MIQCPAPTSTYCASIMLPRSKRETDDPLTSSHNIRFVVPDLSVVHNVNGVDLDLHAYKVEEHHRNNQWVSIGHPVFLKNKNGNIYQFTPESIFMRLQLLSEDQEIALKNMAKKKYPDVEEAFIHLIPLQNIDCTTYLFVSGKKFELHGKAHNLNQYEVTIEIPCEEKSETRRAFYTRIKREDPLNWKCTFTADGKERFVNRIHISAQDIERAVISHTLFGPATEVFVTRNQLTLFSREIRNKLQIEEDYELDEKFDEKLVERLVSLASSTFEDRDIDQVLLKLCKLGFSFDERDLTPNEMKRYLSDLITYHKQGDKEFLSVKNDYKLRAEDDEAATKKAGATLSVGPSYSLGANAEVMKRKVQSLENSNMSVKEQLNEINRDNQFNIKFEFDGSKIVPKTIKVALLNKNDFNRDVSVSYRKIMRKEGRYNKEISISSDCSVDDFHTDNDERPKYAEPYKNYSEDYAKDVGEIMTEKLNRIKEGDESLRKRIDIISANLSSLSFED
uniref:Uncharacterized protein n=1 Tax=Romanomermis culicivorax TaxID=13658 RepID=A0A915HLA1_ROMCU